MLTKRKDGLARGHMRKASKTPLGERLKMAAQERGFTAEQIADRLGVSSAAVWAWWAGRNEPSIETLVAYADLMGLPLEVLAAGRVAKPNEAADLAEWISAFVDLVMVGTDPGVAFDQVTQASGELNARERRSWSRRAAGMRALVTGLIDRPWADLSEIERAEAVRKLLALTDE